MDGEARVQNLLKAMLSRKFDPRQTTLPSDALAKLEAEPADNIIADCKLPEMDGVQFLEEAGKICPAAKKLVLTGNRDLKTDIAALNEARIDCYLAKPVRKEQPLPQEG
ncbi:MAG: response regulator, partial [SAR324 cluster bacterium]|nr:response regulator [SAR324 cluster bacterium]